MIGRTKYTDIEKLKGIKIFYENDIYEYAKVVIKIKDAYVDFQESQGKVVGIGRPTIRGLASRFALTVDNYFPEDYVLKILKQHGFTGKEVLDIKELGRFD